MEQKSMDSREASNRRPIGLGEVGRVLARGWALLLLAPVVFGAVAYLGAPDPSATRTASMTLLASVCLSVDESEQCDIIAGTEIAGQRASVYRAAVASDGVKKLTVDALPFLSDIAELDDAVTVASSQNSPLVEFTVRGADAEQAEALAIAHAQSTIAYVESTVDQQLSDALSTAGITVLSGPDLSAPPASRTLRLPILAAMLGLLVAAGGLIGRWYVDPRLRTAADIVRKTGLPVIADGVGARADLDVHNAVASLRASLQIARRMSGAPRVALISSNRGSGSGDVSKMVSESYGRSGMRVVTVRRGGEPQAEAATSVSLSREVADIETARTALRERDAQSLVCTIDGSDLGIADVLASTEVQRFLTEAQSMCDLILFDLGGDDDMPTSLVGSARCDTAVFVFRPGTASALDVERQIDELDLYGVSVVGASLWPADQADIGNRRR